MGHVKFTDLYLGFKVCGISLEKGRVEDARNHLLEVKLKSFTIDDDNIDFLHPLRPDDAVAQDSDESNDDF